jgi:hypothetical protein
MTAEKLTAKKTCLLNLDDAEKHRGDSLFKEKRLVGGVSLNVLLKRLVLNKRVVRAVWINIRETAQVYAQMRCGGRDIREHHQTSGLLVGILLRPVPLSPDPLLA